MLISEVKIGRRFRKDMGDIGALMASIAEVGLLQPIAVKADGVLLAGVRRLEACKRLGWDDIPAFVVRTADDALRALYAERDENTCRKDFAPSEAVAIAADIEPLEREAARERRTANLPGQTENFTTWQKGRALDNVAAAVGMSRPTLVKAREVVQAAEQEPEKYGDLVERMDDTGKVSPVYQEMKERKNGALFTSDSPEWYTPSLIIDRVLNVMGAIDLDPCSNSKGSPNVPAAAHFTQEDDGLSQEWRGRVYMNPPYGSEIGDWAERLVAEYQAGRVTEAIALIPARTDTQWFRLFREFPRCFIWGRLKFSAVQGSAPFPSVAVYLGTNADVFTRGFADIGDTYLLAE